MERKEIDDLVDLVLQESPWITNEDWYKEDEALRYIVDAENLGLSDEPPKVYFYLKENFFDRHFNERNKFGMVVIRGPRRIGKTSMLKFITKKLIEEGVSPKSLLYFSLDNEKLLGVLNSKKNLQELIEALLEKFNEHKPLIIILDEVTFYNGWPMALKNLVDRGKIGEGVGIIATGSYSLDLRNAKSYLSGRFGPLGETFDGDIFVYPRRFVEVANTIIGNRLNYFMRKYLGRSPVRIGLLEYFGGFQINLI